MALELFTPVVGPSPGTSVKPMVKLKKAEFGDGYTQSSPFGLNHIRDTINLTWSGLLPEEAQSLDLFFRRHSGYIPFLYGGVHYAAPIRWLCDDWSISASAPWTFQAKLVQYFGMRSDGPDGSGVAPTSTISGGPAPVLAALVSGSTIASAYTAGSYTTSAGTISSIVTTYYVNGVARPSSWAVTTGDVIYVSVQVTNSLGIVRTFTTATRTATATVSPAPGLSGLSVVSNEPVYTLTNGPATLYWAVTPVGSADLSVPAILAGTGASDFGNFASGSVGAAASIALPNTSAGDKKIHVFARSGSGDSTVVSAPFTFSIGAVSDTTAPLLTLPTGVQTGATTANGNVTTNEIGGVVYRVITTSITKPTGPQVKLGQNNLGAAAAAAVSQAVVAVGLQTLPGATGIIAATNYYCHFMHEDGATPPNQSLVATSALFTTAAAPAGNPELMETSQAAFDSDIYWSMPTSYFTITGGKLIIDQPNGQNFIGMENTIGQRTPVTATVSHVFKLNVDTVTTPGRFRIFIDQYDATNTYIERLTVYDTDLHGALTVNSNPLTPQLLTNPFTPVAGTVKVSIRIEASIGPVSLTATYVSIKAA